MIKPTTLKAAIQAAMSDPDEPDLCDACGEPASHERYDGRGPWEYACDNCAINAPQWTTIIDKGRE